jgi:hypothetical protein
MKYEFSYLGIGKIWKENVYHWDPYYNHWDFVWFFESSYDSDFLLIEYKHVNVDPVNNNILFTDWKYNYSYYPDSERKNLIYLEWDEDSNEFRQLHKESYSYDALNNLDYMTSFFMSPDNTGWIPSDIFYCWYDNEFSLDNLVLPFILLEEEQADLMFRSKLTNVLLYEWNNLSGKWQHEGIYQLFYSEKSITSLDEVISDLSIYPNPVDDVLYIEGLSDQEYMYVIYDMLGNMLLKTEKIRNQEGIILSAIPEGAYILVLKDQQGKQYSTRIIVHH